MLQMVYRVVDLIQQIKHRKECELRAKTDPHFHMSSFDPFQTNENAIDPNLTECWVVYGPGLPEVNGTYEYQKDHTKYTAERFNNLVNALICRGHDDARVSIREALGIRIT